MHSRVCHYGLFVKPYIFARAHAAVPFFGKRQKHYTILTSDTASLLKSRWIFTTKTNQIWPTHSKPGVLYIIAPPSWPVHSRVCHHGLFVLWFIPECIPNRTETATNNAMAQCREYPCWPPKSSQPFERFSKVRPIFLTCFFSKRHDGGIPFALNNLHGTEVISQPSSRDQVSQIIGRQKNCISAKSSLLRFTGTRISFKL